MRTLEAQDPQAWGLSEQRVVSTGAGQGTGRAAATPLATRGAAEKVAVLSAQPP